MSAKKNFSDNPALRFINPPPAVSPGPAGSAPGGPPMKPNPLFVETKSKRVQLLIQPSLHQKLKTRAQNRGQSLNDLIHTALAAWVDRED